MVGQEYDGASVLSGNCFRVQARIKKVAKYAFYVHSNGHCMNLVMVDCVKKVPEDGEFFTLLQQLYVFVSSTYVNQKWLERQTEMFSGPPQELPSLGNTRWTCQNLLDRLSAVMAVLHDITHEPDSNRAVKARGILCQLERS